MYDLCHNMQIEDFNSKIVNTTHLDFVFLLLFFPTVSCGWQKVSNRDL